MPTLYIKKFSHSHPQQLRSVKTMELLWKEKKREPQAMWLDHNRRKKLPFTNLTPGNI